MLKGEDDAFHDGRELLLRRRGHEHLEAVVDDRLQESEEVDPDVDVAVKVVRDQGQRRFEDVLKDVRDVLRHEDVQLRDDDAEEVEHLGLAGGEKEGGTETRRSCSRSP